MVHGGDGKVGVLASACLLTISVEAACCFLARLTGRGEFYHILNREQSRDLSVRRKYMKLTQTEKRTNSVFNHVFKLCR